MTDLLFFKPPHSASRFTRSHSIYPPLGLCQLSVQFPAGRKRILDAEAEGLDSSAAKIKIADISPQVVLMTASSFTLPLIEEWARWFKENDIRVIAGGPHPTLLPKDFFARCPSVDLAIRGEAESVLPAVIESLLRGKNLPSEICCQRTPGGEILVGRVQRISNFRDHPFPDFTGLDMTRYWCPDARCRPMATMMTTRGCRHRCSFCSAPALSGGKVRGWAPTQVLDELTRLASRGIREISFLDDGFTSNRERAKALCSVILERGLNLSWFCNARADCLDEELALVMAKSGCHQVYLGLESGSEQILRSVNKDLHLDQVRRGARLLRGQGIGISAGFVIGLPGESEYTVAETIRLARELQPDRIQFSRFTPLPGSPLGRKAGKISGGDFHSRGQDLVGRWIEEAYRQCRMEAWGRPSW